MGPTRHGERRRGAKGASALAVVALTLALARLALATETLASTAPRNGDLPVAPTTAPAARATALPLVLEVRGDQAGLNAEAVRDAIEDELQWPVLLDDPAAARSPLAPRVTVDVSATRRELSVRYDEPGRPPLLRTIPAPAHVAARMRTIAWLTGNLVRDQTADLLRENPEPPRTTAASPPAGPAASPLPALLPSSLPPASPPDPPVAAERSTPAATAVAVAGLSVDDAYRFFTAAVFFPLATNARRADVRTRLSLNLIYGRVGMIDSGLQLGPANAVMGDVDGGQVGLLFNRAGGSVHGLQVAGAVNATGGSVRGLQVAFGTNHAGGDVEGAQVAFVNNVRGDLRGAQTGVVNVAGDVRGMQVGLVNVGRRVRGVQLGLVNVSDDIEGMPIGLINVSASGGIHPTIWTSGTTQVAVGVKFSTRHLYTLFSGAMQPDRGQHLFGPGLALGLRLPIRWLVLESDVGGAYLFGGSLRSDLSREEAMQDDIALASWRLIASVELHRRFSVFVGAALTTRLRFYQSVTRDVSYEIGPDLFAGVQL